MNVLALLEVEIIIELADCWDMPRRQRYVALPPQRCTCLFGFSTALRVNVVNVGSKKRTPLEIIISDKARSYDFADFSVGSLYHTVTCRSVRVRLDQLNSVGDT